MKRVQHWSLMHRVDGNETCEFCGKVFNNNRQLREHIRSHDESKSCTCELCGKVFKVLIKTGPETGLAKNVGLANQLPIASTTILANPIHWQSNQLIMTTCKSGKQIQLVADPIWPPYYSRRQIPLWFSSIQTQLTKHLLVGFILT